MQPGVFKRGVIAADDSAIIRTNVRAALGDPWRLFLAVDGAEAIEYARRVQADLVLLDLRMPRIDGIEACAFIRTLPGYGTVPIVLLTAYDSPDLRRRAKNAGVTSVFAKPFTSAALRERAAALTGSFPLNGHTAGLPPFGLAEQGAPWDMLDAGRDVLAVHRQVEAAANERRYTRFTEIMAAWRAQMRR